MQPTVLVTGATGFVGRHVVISLLTAGYSVCAIARSAGDLERRRGFTSVSWDLTDESRPPERPRDIEVVVHLAARMPRPEDLNVSFVENVLMTKNLLAFVEPKHIVFGSSVDVYGRARVLPIREEHPTAPLTPYAASKLESEQMLLRESASRGFSLTILRVAQVYGPGDTSAKAIPSFTEAILSGRRPALYGDGSDLRDYVYVDDAAQAFVLAVEQRAAGTFNISGGREYSIADVLNTVIRIGGTNLEPTRRPRRAEKMDLWFDISHAREILRYAPRITIEEGLRRYVRWTRGHRGA